MGKRHSYLGDVHSGQQLVEFPASGSNTPLSCRDVFAFFHFLSFHSLIDTCWVTAIHISAMNLLKGFLPLSIDVASFEIIFLISKHSHRALLWPRITFIINVEPSVTKLWLDRRTSFWVQVIPLLNRKQYNAFLWMMPRILNSESPVRVVSIHNSVLDTSL